jgi:hypothetical protein
MDSMFINNMINTATQQIKSNQIKFKSNQIELQWKQK